MITGVEKQNGGSPRLYPNPAKDFFKIASQGNQPVGIKVLDLGGRVIYETDALGSEQEINVANLASGIYIVQIRTINSFFVQKLVVQK